MHPFDDEDVIAGQGTIGLEIIKQLRDVDVVVVPVGGGGLISGVAFALKSLNPNIRVYGVQASGAPSMVQSLEMDEIICLARFNAERNRYEQMSELDSKFHQTLYNACGSKMLRHILRDFHKYVESVRKQTLSRSERALAAIDEHEKILDAIKNRDEETADHLASEHIINTINNLRARGFLK